MNSGYDFKKEWPRIKKELTKVSQEALALAKKGEKELVRVSHLGRLHVDSTAVRLKKEHLYHLIGKEYVRARCPGTKTPRLKELVEELRALEQDSRKLARQMKGKGGAGKRPGPAVKKKAVTKKSSS